ncbi:MAG: MMPL family transporter [Planctomycetota bacterium]|nr:MMPL family transporter [Planctomycetota bacterium]
MHERIRDAILQRWARFVTERPILTLVACLTLAIASIVLTFSALEFQADRSDLVERSLPWNQRYRQYKESFQGWDSLLVCLEGEPDDSSLDDLARLIGERLLEDPRIASAHAGFLETQTDPRLFVLAPANEFESIMERIEAGHRLASTHNANEALGLALGSLQNNSENEMSLDDLRRVLNPYLKALRGELPDFDFLDSRDPRWRSLKSESGRLRFIQVQFANEEIGLDTVSANLRWLRHEVLGIVQPHGLADEAWGVTGIPAIEADETVQSIRDSTLSSIIAFIAITLLMLVVFRGVTVPMLAAGSLLVGMAWSFGWLVISVGHLQLLSVVFSVILLGLGIDFALHLVARLELVQDEHEDLPSAMTRVFRGIGPGMLTGAITTAAAFAATAFTDFKGMAEMGIIAGGGILLCLVAMLSVFPAALALTGRWKKIIRHRPGGEAAHFAHGRLDLVDTHPRPTLMLAGLGILALLWFAQNVRYDPNVLNLHPPEIESVVWEKKLVAEDARSVWSALLRTTPDEAADLTKRLRALPAVSDVGGLGLLFPAELEARRQRIDQVRKQSHSQIELDGSITTLRTQLATILQGMVQFTGSLSPSNALKMQILIDEIDDALSVNREFSVERNSQLALVLNDSFHEAQVEVSNQIDAALSREPIGADNLPDFLHQQWVSADGSWLLMAYPSMDTEGRSILHPQRLGPFIESIRTVDENVFGPPVQIYESSRLIVRAYIQAAIYAVILIFILLWLDFRSIADSICAMTPVSIGFIGVFGLIGLTNVPLNFANIIVMPMIFGIGVDAGVHMVHRWRTEPRGRPAGLSGATGRGITLTMFTTMIGFGSLTIAEHRGIRSLGFVMIAGLGVTLLACYVVLPPILRLRSIADRSC